ncbi:MAG: class I SAM-dependent methyltransferase [Candidatus Lokiarchaeota archaeon]|nr:class I SAM-dependent methyltransferase [Candidatus Lokiarchaeota archaeon]
MTQDIFPPILYTFLDYALDAEVEKTIIDCGAGGKFPKIALYAMIGFETYGIEISEERMKMAEDFAKKRGLKVHIVKGDIRSLPYESESYGFTYSYNTIFHMNKEDLGVAINEMLRVVKKHGLIYVNLLSIDDSR